jgi:hypothetical protein
MTFAVSLQYEGGVVFGADTLISHGLANQNPAFSHYENKIYQWTGRDHSLLMTGAGDVATIKTIFEALVEDVGREEGPPEEPNSLIGGIKASFKEKLQLYLPNSPQTVTSIILAFSARPWRGLVLRSDDWTLNTAKDVEFCGLGENSLVRFLADSFYYHKMRMNEAIVLAIFLVWAAKKYCPQYCAGETNIEVLEVGGDLDCSYISKEEIERVEDLIKKTGPGNMKALLDEAAQNIK